MVLSPLKKVALLLLCGAAFGLLGILLHLGFPSLQRKLIQKNTRIVRGSKLYEFWKTVPIPIYLEVYLFNITNPKEIYELKSKPKLKEVGPYTFLEERKKVDIKWHDNGTVSYRQIKQFHFRPELSNGSLDDTIINLNSLMISMAAEAKRRDSIFVYMTLIELFDMSGCTWIIQRTARELLFGGYTEKLFNLSASLTKLPQDKVGYFYGLNDTDDGQFTVFTGEVDINKLNDIDKVNGLPYIQGFDPPCNSVEASTGELFPPFQNAENVTVFGPDICRKLTFTHSHRSQYQNLKSIVYVASKDELDNGQTIPEMKCYCRDNNCLAPGAFDLSGCKFGAPIVASYPHFLFADSSYSNGVLGLQQPDPIKHQSFIEIQPQTGVPLRAEIKLQLNIIFEGNEYIPQFQNITARTYVPVLWVCKRAALDEDMTAVIRFALNIVPLAVDILQHFSFFSSALLLVFAFVSYTLYSASNIWIAVPREPQTSIPLGMKDILKVKAEILLDNETVV